LTCGEWAERFLARYRRYCKDSSYDTAKSALARFTDDFGNGPIVSITRLEAIDWAEWVAAYRLPVVVTLFNAAVDAELIERNPFGGLSCRTRGRSDEHPPTKEQMDRLVARLLRIGLVRAADAGAADLRRLLGDATRRAVRPRVAGH
jgi:hypothetical protein